MWLYFFLEYSKLKQYGFRIGAKITVQDWGLSIIRCTFIPSSALAGTRHAKWGEGCVGSE